MDPHLVVLSFFFAKTQKKLRFDPLIEKEFTLQAQEQAEHPQYKPNTQN
jgi:hypothetical protein